MATSTHDTTIIPSRYIKRQGPPYSSLECLQIEPTDILASTWHNLYPHHQSTKNKLLTYQFKAASHIIF